LAIAVIDDSMLSLKVIEKYLTSSGFSDILTFISAKDAYRAFELNTPLCRKDIDLILVDIVMPDIDGIQVCRTIKENYAFADVPVIMVTGLTDKENLQLAFSAGAVDYIRKPVDKTELLVRVSSALRLKHEIDRRKSRELELMARESELMARESELLVITRQLEDTNNVLKGLSFLDGLTGIANRRHFDEVLVRECKRAKRDNNYISLLMIDIDYFKAYNDTYGHLGGDDCLKAVALSIRETLKRPGDFVARYGGEEFVVILPNTEESGAYTIAESIRANVIGLRIRHENSKCCEFVSVSVGGVSQTPGISFSPESLVSTADKTLYRSKQEGRNRVIVVDNG